MKRSYLLILIVLIPLLTAAAAKQLNREADTYNYYGTFNHLLSPSPRPRPTQQPSESAGLAQQKGQQKTPPVNLSYLPQTENQGHGAANNRNDTSDTPTVVIAIFAVVSGLAALAIAWFNCQLVNVTRDLHKASLAATEVAMSVHRPFLLSLSGRFKSGQWLRKNPTFAMQSAALVVTWKTSVAGQR